LTAPSPPARQRLLPNLVLSAVVALFFAGLLELGARLLAAPPPVVEDYIWDWEQKWEGDFYTMRSDAVGWPPWEEFNGDGVRDRTHAEEKPEGVTRLICLGDSVTLGDGIKPRQAFPQLLQERLDAEGPGVEVFNLALWGWSTRQERIAYRRIARRYGPDRVLLTVCLNDIPELQNNLSRPPGWLTGLYQRSALVRLVVDARGREIRSVEELFEEPAAHGVEAGFERFFEELRALRDDVTEDGAELAVAVMPFRFQLEPDAPEPTVQRRIARFCAESGLPCLDLLDPLRALGPEAFHDYDHLSPAGARKVADVLLHSRLLPRPLPVRELLGERPSLDHVIDALGSADEPTRRAAAWELSRRGGAAAVEPLTKTLDDASPAVRAEAARALGALGPAARSAMPALFARLADPRQRVRWEAALALFHLGPRAPESVRPLIAALESPDVFVRGFAAFSLGSLGKAAHEAVPALITALQSEEGYGRGGAALALAKMGEAAREAIPALVSGLESQDPEHRWKAARALGRIGLASDGALEALVRALEQDPDERVRAHAARALGRIGPAATPAARALEAATRDRVDTVREEARRALQEISR
jgi:HEAT repeat protein/lysophospholipase L1-like esterase